MPRRALAPLVPMLLGLAHSVLAGPEWPPTHYWDCRADGLPVSIERIDDLGGKLWFRGRAFDFVHDPATDSWRTLVVSPPRVPGEPAEQTWAPRREGEDSPPAERSLVVGGRSFRCEVIFRPRPGPPPNPLIEEENFDILFRAWAQGKAPPEPVLLWSAGDKDSYQDSILGVGEVMIPARACFFDGQRLWIGFDFLLGEGFEGIGTLVAYDPDANALEVHQPRELRDEGIVELVVHRGQVWAIPYRSAEWTGSSEHALLHYDPSTRRARGFKFEGSPLLDDEVSVLRLAGDHLWVAGGRHVYRIDLATGAFRRFRIVNFARLPTGGAPVFSAMNDAQPRAVIADRMVEALWQCEGWLEVSTRDCVAGELRGHEWGPLPPWSEMIRTGGEGYVAFAGARLDELGADAAGARKACAHAGWIRDEGAVIGPEIRELRPWHPSAPAGQP